MVTTVLALILLSAVPNVSAETYHTQSYRKDDVYDISLNWSDFLGSRNWITYKLWDEISTHCYVSFKFNVGAALSIPASLRLNYPAVVEPGQQFNIESELNIAENKQLSFTSEFFVKIDLDLPGIVTYIPGLGFVDTIKNTYGGAWEFKFDLNSKTIERVLNQIWLGNEQNTESFSNNLDLSSYVTIQDININSQTLGPLASGSIKINILKAILTAAKNLSTISPPISAIVTALDWLLTNVIKVDTGVIITPSLNAEIISPISSSPELSIGTTNIIFGEDISSKQTASTISGVVKETASSNTVDLTYGPLAYRLSLINDWKYYLNLDIDFLNLDIYQNTWSWNLGIFPSFSTEVAAITRQINCNLKLDEPLQAATPETNDGEVSIEISDSSGVSNIALFYSLDRASWERINMVGQGEKYLAKPISSVQQDTTVYYYFEATDGDNDSYRIDNNGIYYSYTLKPEPKPIIPDFSRFFSDFGNVFSGVNIVLIVVAIMLIIGVVCLFLFVRKGYFKS